MICTIKHKRWQKSMYVLYAKNSFKWISPNSFLFKYLTTLHWTAMKFNYNKKKHLNVILRIILNLFVNKSVRNKQYSNMRSIEIPLDDVMAYRTKNKKISCELWWHHRMIFWVELFSLGYWSNKIWNGIRK